MEDSSPADPLSISPEQDVLGRCPMCDFSSRHPRSLQRHLKHHGSDQSFKCPLCSYSVGSVPNLSRHINQHHQGFKEDETAKMSTRQNHQLEQNQQQIEEEEASSIHRCGKCDYTAKSLQSMRNHEALHDKQSEFQCSFCSYSVTNVSHLTRHVKQHHLLKDADVSTPQEGELGEASSHNDEIQEESFDKTNNEQDNEVNHLNPNMENDEMLEEEMESEGELEEPVKKLFRCSECDFYGKSNSSLRHHRQLHSKKSSHQCPKCSFSVSRLSHLNRHLREHHDNRIEDGEASLRCGKCDYVAKTIQKLRNHESLHGNKNNGYQCPFCCYSVSTANPLTRHINEHHQLKNDENVVVDSASPDHLPDEENDETLEEPMAQKENDKILEEPMEQEEGKNKSTNLLYCPFCEFSTKKRSNFQIHELCHREKSKFQCPHCSFSAGHSSHLSRHVNSYHKLLCQEKEAASSSQDEVESDHIFEKRVKSKEEKAGSRKLFSCRECKFAGKYKSSLILHESFHQTKSKFQCPRCSFSVSTASHMSRHVSHHHKDDEMEAVPADDVSIENDVIDSASSDDLSDEEEEEVENEESIQPEEDEELESMYFFYCPVCEFFTRTLISIQRHELCHRNKAKFQCPHCSFSVNSSSHLSRHINSHHQLLLQGIFEKVQESSSPNELEIDQAFEEQAESNDELDSEASDDLADEVDCDQVLDEQSELSEEKELNLFYCPFCEFSGNKHSLARHELFHSNKSKFQCPHCSFSVSSASHLSRHITRYHHLLLLKDDGMDDYHVSDEDDEIESASLNNNLPDEGKEGSEKRFYCKYCECSSKQKSIVQRHETYHHTKSKFQCPHCSFSVNFLTHLTRHINSHHLQLLQKADSALSGDVPDEEHEMDYDLHDEDEEPAEESVDPKKDKSLNLHYCPHCEFNCKDKSNLKRHGSYHRIKSSLQCPHCSFSVSNASRLSRHINGHHRLLLKNDEMGAASSDGIPDEEEEVENYESINPEEELVAMNLYYCPVCEFAGGSLTSIQRHELCHRNKSEFQCPHCSFSVGHSSHLSRHITSHHQLLLNGDEMDNSGRDGECSLSTNPLSVGNASHLSHHVTSDHSSIKDDEVEEIVKKQPRKRKFANVTGKFQCEFCNFSTDRADRRNLHNLGHTRNQKFKCSRCNFSANFASTIVFHEGHHHREPSEPSKPSGMRECYVPLRDLFSHLNLPEATLLSNAKSWVEVKEIEVAMNMKTIRSSMRKIEQVRSSENQSSKIEDLKEELRLKSSRKNGLKEMIGELLSKKSRAELRLLKMRAEILNVGLGDGAQMMEEKVILLKEELKGIEKRLEKLCDDENRSMKEFEELKSSLKAVEVDLRRRDTLNGLIDSTQAKIFNGFQLESRLAKIRLLEARSGARQRRNSLLEVLENVVDDHSDC